MTTGAAPTLERPRARELDIRLLGPIGAERAGESVALGGPRQRAVLARLALVAGQVVTVDRLVEDVWSGTPPATAVNTLQSYVSLLRRALGDPQLLRRDGPGYVLNVDRDALDAARFESRATAGRARLATDPLEALGLLDEALAEWRGPALADVADEEWARSAAVRWDELRLAALESRFDALLGLGRHNETIAELERATDEFPLREGLARRLMIALYRSGRQADALRTYSRTRELLADELGLDPTPELTALQTAILNHDPALARPEPPVAAPGPGAPRSGPAAAPAPAASAASAAPAAPAAPARSPVPLPGPAVRAATRDFVGRTGELIELHRVWAEARQGARRLVLVDGEAGAGKSALAARFAAEAHEEGAIVLWGRATAEAVVPFEPMVEAVRTVLNTVSPEARRRVAADRGLLSLLLPELDQLVPEAQPQRADPEVERYLLFETIAELLRAESEQHPLLVVLDDFHWADGPSLKLIEHVLRHELPARLMVLATVRVPSETPHIELDRMAIGLARDRLLSRVTVDGLATADVDELLRSSGRTDVDADELRAATGGNAFFVSELIRHAGGPVIDEDVPASVRAMIGVRLDGLDLVVNQVLSLVALAGPAATLPVLVAASELDGDRLLDATDTALNLHLLVEDGAGRLAMPHALIRQVVVSRLGRTRRLDLHRRIGEALAHAGEPHDAPGTMAYHLFEAGSLTDRRRRLEAGLAAGRHALKVGAYEDAAAWVERLGSLAQHHAAPVDLARLETLAADTARARGDRATAVAAARRAAEHARASGDPMLLAYSAEAWMEALSAVGFDIGRPADPELVDLMETAIAALDRAEQEPDQRRHAVRLRSMLSSVLVPGRDPARRDALAAEALTIAEADGRPELIASANLARRLALWRVDLLDERAAAALMAVDEARRAGNIHLELTSLLFAMTDLMEMGRLAEHAELLAEYKALAAVLHQPLYEVYATFIDAGNALQCGRYDEALQLADAALAAGLAAHGVNAVVAHAGVWMHVHHDRGTLEQTIDRVRELLAEHPRLRMWQLALARSLALSGRVDEARPIFDQLVGEDAVRLHDNQMLLPGNCVLVEIAEALGDTVRAGVLRRALEPYTGRLAVSGPGGITFGPVARFVGVAARLTGDLTAAERHLRDAVAVAVRLDLPPHEAAARRDLAATLLARGGPGDDDAARAELARAQAIAAGIGMVLAPVG